MTEIRLDEYKVQRVHLKAKPGMILFYEELMISAY
jgi:hypothetical protein